MAHVMNKCSCTSIAFLQSVYPCTIAMNHTQLSQKEGSSQLHLSAFSYGNQIMCSQVQPNLIPLASLLLKGKPLAY